ncbi:MAG: hypothetical protein JSU09_13035 [Bacteroidetes bacterium]|nr:hypothetical protein [Bacteroidota bacterium]
MGGYKPSKVPLREHLQNPQWHFVLEVLAAQGRKNIYAEPIETAANGEIWAIDLRIFPILGGGKSATSCAYPDVVGNAPRSADSDDPDDKDLFSQTKN